MVATKPRVNMRLVSKRFAREYSERCASQNKLFVRADPENLEYDFLPKDSDLHLNVLHLHLGKFDFMDSARKTLWALRDLDNKVTNVCCSLPSLRAVYLKLYVGNYNIKLDDSIRVLVRCWVASVGGRGDSTRLVARSWTWVLAGRISGRG